MAVISRLAASASARALGGVVVGLALAVALAPSARAQISPGPLSRPHAALEGSGQCLKCHDPGRGVAAEKCLACHRVLKERIGAGQGLHARPEYRDCKTCHVEHQGLEYDLVWWGKAGREAFDHHQAGFALEGRHAHLACAACHQPAHNQNKDALAAEGLSLTRTYQGLGTTCASCHADPHRGQFVGRGCTSCHTQEAWRPAPGFDHARTGYPLAGRHAAVSCEKCHRATGSVTTVRQYKGAPRDCAACHRDVHEARFGGACARCHSPAGWQRIERASFDHGRTAYPLQGRHAALACDRCHAAGKPLRLKHDRCTDCHADTHLGQLARRADQGRCEACHDVGGFTPARFALDEHQKTAYPLTGSHLAVPCDACHRPVGRDALTKLPGVSTTAGAGGRTARFRFASTRCAECHRDPHKGEVDKYLRKGGCEACHRVESWRQVVFDHSQTRFLLSGGHAKPACVACHKKQEAGTPRERIRLAALPLACAECHKDPHQGQFARPGASVSCERCHTTDTVKASRFDHARDSVYALDGAHARLACAACHRPEKRGRIVFVRYKPLPTTCKGCHAPAPRKEAAR